MHSDDKNDTEKYDVEEGNEMTNLKFSLTRRKFRTKNCINAKSIFY